MNLLSADYREVVVRIGILTSGGDAPGMNAAVRAAVRRGIAEGHNMVGIMHGYKGLIDGNSRIMDVSSVANIIHRGGTVLKTARCDEFRTEEGRESACGFIRRNEIDGLVVIGGDGTLRGAHELVKAGISVAFVPATIDSDLAYTDYTIGYDTAVNTVVSAISSIRETGMSHDKTTIIEVMGRDCGNIALRSGICGGADAILIPEVETDIRELTENIRCGIARCKRNNIIIRAEGADISMESLSDEIEKVTGEKARKVILGYLQRGGTPSALDIYMATLMGSEAVDVLQKGENDTALGFNGFSVTYSTIGEALSCEREPDLEIIRTAYRLI